MIGKKAMMACGHATNARNSKGEPACAICVGIDPGAEVVVEEPINAVGRFAKCSCGVKKPSSTDLAFFEFLGEGSREAREMCECGYSIVAHSKGLSRVCNIFSPRGDVGHDRFYCGHSGWN